MIIIGYHPFLMRIVFKLFLVESSAVIKRGWRSNHVKPHLLEVVNRFWFKQLTHITIIKNLLCLIKPVSKSDIQDDGEMIDKFLD